MLPLSGGVRLIRLTAMLWFLACLCVPGFAYGATVSLEQSRFDGLTSSFTYEAAPGEANVVEISFARSAHRD